MAFEGGKWQKKSLEQCRANSPICYVLFMKARKDLALSGVCSSNSLHFRSPFQFNAPDGGGYVWDVLYSARVFFLFILLTPEPGVFV